MDARLTLNFLHRMLPPKGGRHHYIYVDQEKDQLMFGVWLGDHNICVAPDEEELEKGAHELAQAIVDFSRAENEPRPLFGSE